jgi:hypothetical protein
MLERLRAKPHHIKQHLSLVITIVIFSGIVFVWWSSRDARDHELEVQAKTVTPLDGFLSMFDGLVQGFKANVFEISSVATSTASSTSDFDLSQVVVIDPSVQAGGATTTQNSLINTHFKLDGGN